MSPSRRDSLGVALFSTGGGAKFKTVEAWDVGPTRNY